MSERTALFYAELFRHDDVCKIPKNILDEITEILGMNFHHNTLLGERLLEAARGFVDVLARTEGGASHVAVTGRTETGARGGDDVRLFKNLREDFPGIAAVEGDPHVRRVRATVHGVTHFFPRLLEDGGVLLVEAHQIVHRGEAGVREARETGALRDVGRTVETGAHHASPVGADRGAVGELERLREDGPAET